MKGDIKLTKGDNDLLIMSLLYDNINKETNKWIRFILYKRRDLKL